MVATAFFGVLVCMGLSFGLCLLGCVLVYAFQNEIMARGLFEYWTFNFNGLLVGGTGWGMAYLVLKESKSILNRILNIIDVPEDSAPVLLAEFSKTTNFRRIFLFGTAIAVLGATTLILSGYPLSGLAQLYLGVGSISLHFTGAYLLVHLVYCIKFFRFLESRFDLVTLRPESSYRELTELNMYYVLTATLGIFGLYFAFRGTLTAGFTFSEPIFQKFLIYPLLVYLPIGLMYSFYPRYVLKRLYDESKLERLEELDELGHSIISDESLSPERKVELQASLGTLRRNLREESKRLPLVSLKDYPSLALVFLMFIQSIIYHDNVITDFLRRFGN